MLQPIELPDLFDASPPAEDARALLAEAERRVDAFLYHRRGPVIHSFVTSDFRAVDAHLRWIVERRLTTGRAFCELGSGFGVNTMLAALHDFDACGIEVEEELVEQARRLAEHEGISAEFVCGSAIPNDWDAMNDYVMEDFANVDLDTPSAYDELGLDLTDFDLVFAYPWPGEELFWEDLFDQYAADGALLLTYHGIEDLRLHRRVRG